MLLVRRLSRGRSGFARTTRTHSVAPAASSTIRSYSVTTESSPGLRIGVVGLGAIGTIFFAKLARLAAAPPPDSTLPRVCSVDAFVRPQQLMAWVNEESLSPRVKLAPSSGSTSKDGQVDLRFHSATDSKELMVTAENAPSVRVRALELLQGDAVVESDRIDVVLVAVKAYDSAETIHELQRAEYANLFKRDVLCVLLQNGLGEGLPSHESGPNGAAQNNRSDWQFANGVTFIGGRVTAFGSVATSGVETGATYLAPIGDARACSDKVDAVVNVLQAAGLRCEELSAGKMQATLWRKLIVNAAINPIASLLDGPNKTVGGCEWSRRCVSMVVGEAFAVAQSERVPLDCTREELEEEVLRVASNTGANICSMLSDLRRGSRTEIDAISGRIVAAGKRHGVATPANELLLALVKAREGMSTRTRS